MSQNSRLVNDYLESLYASWNGGNANGLSSCFSLRPAEVPGGILFMQALQNVDIDSVSEWRNRGPVPPYISFLAPLLQALKAVGEDKKMEAAEHYMNAYNKFAEGAFKDSAGNWLLGTLYSMTRCLRDISREADKQAESKDDHTPEQDKYVRLCVSKVQVAFKNCTGDKDQDWQNSKKLGAIYLANICVALYFQLNVLKSCANAYASVKRTLWSESRGSHVPDYLIPKGDMVTFKFYAGRLEIFEDKYMAARESLMYALRHCHKDAFANRQRILAYLIPVQLFFGRLPSAQLLARYKFTEYEGFVSSIRRGDLKLFNETLEKYEHHFIRSGTFLLLERVRMIVQRNLLKQLLNGGFAPAVGKSPLLPLATIQKAFEIHGVIMDLDELECVMANLMYRGIVKGYISHQKRTVVLKETESFPTAGVIPNLNPK